MGLKDKNLIASKKVVRAVGGSTITCKGWLPVQFTVGERSTKQALYICDNIEKLYFSKTACIDVGILPPLLPHTCDNVASLRSQLDVGRFYICCMHSKHGTKILTSSATFSSNRDPFSSKRGERGESKDMATGAVCQFCLQ